MSNQKYYFFIDETGDHGLSFIDDNFPIFLLAGCLINQVDLEQLERNFNSLKQNIFGSTAVIFHNRDIRKCEGTFQSLFDLELKQKFYSGLNSVIGQSHFTIISAGIDKNKHIDRYGKSAMNPYMICLSFILERLVFCLDSKQDAATVDIIVEKRGRLEDKQLIAHYNSVTDRGTLHVNSSRFSNKIASFELVAKRENSNGLQLADLCAYPIARYVLNAAEPYIPFQIIREKLYCRYNGDFNGYGLKMFP